MDEEIRKKLIKQGKLVDKWGKKITEAENSEIIAEETEYNESIRRNLIKQGKLVDEWGRKIQDKKQYTKNITIPKSINKLTNWIGFCCNDFMYDKILSL